MKKFVKIFISILLCTGLISPVVFAGDGINILRGKAPLSDVETAPEMMPYLNKDIREMRNYPEQPPVIPHKIDGYQVDQNSNKCLTCHDRSATGESQAPMVSITHYMDRDNQFLATISPRRYYCNQCHVPQRDVKPLLKNDFVDIDQLLKADKAKQ